MNVMTCESTYLNKTFKADFHSWPTYTITKILFRYVNHHSTHSYFLDSRSTMYLFPTEQSTHTRFSYSFEILWGGR